MSRVMSGSVSSLHRWLAPQPAAFRLVPALTAALAVVGSAPIAHAQTLAPTNLGVLPVYSGGSADKLTWTKPAGAVSFNVYQYDRRIASGLKSNSYTVPTKLFTPGVLYTVTAVNSAGKESIYSQPAHAIGGVNKNPSWTPSTPATPKTLKVIPQWNNGKPRNLLNWVGNSRAWTYNVYRDGVLVGSNLYTLYFVDDAVSAGRKYSYQVEAINFKGPTMQKSARSSAVTGTALSKSPVSSVGVISKVTVEPNDDSVVLTFAAVPGAVDYRVYNVAKPNVFKYSGGKLELEVNGLDPKIATQLVVEAVDKFGPYQKMDGFHMPAAPTIENINGQGDPSNVPNVIARSGKIAPKFVDRTLKGAQAFFDNFRGSQPFKPTTAPSVLAKEFPNQVAALANDKWMLTAVQAELNMTECFVMSNHFMDTVYDGGTVGSGIPAHVSNASLIMTPRKTADISGGKVLHVTYEVDGRYNIRRWCELLLTEAGDELRAPAKFMDFGKFPSVKGNAFLWSVEHEFHRVVNVLNKGGKPTYIPVNNVDWATGATDRFGASDRTKTNGTDQDLDLRSQFDLYLSTTRAVGMENGKVVFDKKLTSPLPFTKITVNFIHEVYHTDLDRAESIDYAANKANYWINFRPYADERHWDNMGFEVLNAFPF
ncbi:MAG: hypothetical protein SFU56_17990 [Capsulimonadales bacterium]|nr:hypothetical protein [Capsulimonadales bacterium]